MKGNFHVQCGLGEKVEIVSKPYLSTYQCLYEDTEVKTEQGMKKVKELKIGDKVLTSLGRNKLDYREIDNVTSKYVETDLVVLKTKSGKEIKGTQDHIIYTKMRPEKELHYVYLMYRHDIGFRVGMTISSRRGKQGKSRVGIAQRLNKEKGDKVWVIRKCMSASEARGWEEYYSEHYDIPQHVFKLEKSCGYEPRLTPRTLLEKHIKLGTVANGHRLLNDLGMNFEYPHYTPKAKFEKCTLNYKMLSSGLISKEGVHKSEISADTSNEEYLEVLEKHLSIRERPAIGIRQKYYTASNTTFNIDSQVNLLKDIRKECESKGIYLTIKKQVKLTESCFDFMPLGNVIEGMMVAVEIDGRLIEDEVVSVTRENYRGYVYDLSVPTTRNFIANSIVVSNCIYSWRGSDIDIINKRFEEDYKPVVKQLTTNYRCSQNILDAVVPSIEKNTMRHPKKLRAYRPGGEVNIVVDGSVNHLMEEIKKDLERGETVGVIARTNADLLIPAMLLELDEKEVDFGVSKLVSLESRIPKQVIGVMDLITKRYTPEFESLLKMFVGKYRHYEVEKLCDVLNLNKEKSLFSLPLEDLRHSAPTLFPILNALRVNNAVSPKHAYIGLLDTMIQEVYNGKSIYAQRARDFVYYVKKIIQEHETIKEMSLAEIEELFTSVIPNKLSRRKNLGNKRLFIKLTTVHEAKGKEWDNVYIWNNIDGCFPNSVGNRELTPSEFEEERRVHYIAWTRPKRKLTVYTRSDRESGFLAECDLTSANLEEVHGISSKSMHLKSDEGTQVFQKKEDGAEKSFKEEVESYYRKYMGYEWIVKSEGINLDICDVKLGGKEKVIAELEIRGIDKYPHDMIESAITDTLAELACVYLR